MREFQERQQERRKIRRRIYSKTSLVILLILLILTARGVASVYSKEKLSNQDLQSAQYQKSQLQARASAVEEDQARLNTSDGVEAEIRSKFDVAKPGEGVIVIVDKPAPIPEPAQKTMIQKFWDAITSVFSSKDKATSTVQTVPGISTSTSPAQ